MSERITIRIPKETHQFLKAESAKLGLTLAELVRQWLENYQRENRLNLPRGDQENPDKSKIQKEYKSLHPLLLENNLLLRKIARHTNSQIVIETDEQLEQLLKKGGA